LFYFFEASALLLARFRTSAADLFLASPAVGHSTAAFKNKIFV